MFTPADHLFISRALELGARGLNTTTPNPRVGCVIVRDGVIIGEGYHIRAGEPHAEIHALITARAEVGADGLAGATCYVSLEPCNHFGRTPPCTTALIEARLARVVAAMEDPDPRVAGVGLAALRHAGIDVRCGLLRAEAEALNIGFVSRMTRGRPWVRLRIDASGSGFADEVARDGRAWRARACALLTGYGSIRDDDPDFDIEAVELARKPMRALIDSQLRSPLESRLFRHHGIEAPVVVFCASEYADAAREFRAAGIEVVACANGAGKVDLQSMLVELGRRGVNELHVEAGDALNASLLREGWVDELLVYLSPGMIGPGRSMSDLPELAALDNRLRLEFVSLESVGSDIRALARVIR
ncbi:bifunctional diaminohydroxyphosphoribosylaminopyrimidine deaminase/5-amino-6-(5-phosphoribosylamino)uracil reductase RibD [soil metagenome]